MVELTRREFNGVALGAIGAGVVSPSVLLGDDDAAPTRDLRMAVKLEMVHGDASLHDKFALLKRLGYHGVEISSPNTLDADEVIAARDATGLIVHGTVCSTHWQYPLSHNDEAVRDRGRRGVERAIADCARYGGDTVLVVPGVVNKHVSYAACYERSQALLRKVLPLAEDAGVRIGIENVWNKFLLSPLEAARYVDQLESDAAGWYFDVGNIVNYGWPEHWIQALGRRIVKIDIKEFSRSKRDDEGLWRGFAVELLEGDCDWPAVMRKLDAIGYRGWATAEIAGGGEDRLREIATRMQRIFAS
jgi:L-ribulose-5-phosphate 3-epimerase